MEHLYIEVKAAGGDRLHPSVSSVLRMFRNQRQISLILQCISLDRAAARMASTGPQKARSWYHLSAVERAVGRSRGTGICPAGCRELLMLPDADRQLVHNEYLRVEMLADRCVHDSPVDTLRAPMAAIASRLYAVGCAWLHDRCRDALVWHAAHDEQPASGRKASPTRINTEFVKDYNLEFLQVQDVACQSIL